MDIDKLIKEIQEAGIAGAGGAGFPAYGKLNAKLSTLILNCAECEPLLKVHRQMLKYYAYEILSTLDRIGKILNIDHILIAIKASYHDTAEAVGGYLNAFPKIELKLLPEIYPAGDEIVLIYETTGRVLPAGAIPASAGIAVYNVETAYNMYLALEEAAPVTHKYITIAGEVEQPITIRAPIGTQVSEVIKYAGRITVPDAVYVIGGPMTGTIADGWSPVTKTTNGVLVLPKDHYVIKKKRSKNSINMKRAMASCCQCRMCTDLCPRNLLGHPIVPHEFMHGATSGHTKNLKPFLGTLYCSACGLCEMYACTQELSPRSLMEEYKNGLKKSGVTFEPAPNHTAHPFRNYRSVPSERLISRLDLLKYNVDAGMSQMEIRSDQVMIPLNQHIGAPSTTTVKKGEYVLQGQKIGNQTEGKLSLPVHASISGVVREITKEFIWLAGMEKRR